MGYQKLYDRSRDHARKDMPIVYTIYIYTAGSTVLLHKLLTIILTFYTYILDIASTGTIKLYGGNCLSIMTVTINPQYNTTGRPPTYS